MLETDDRRLLRELVRPPEGFDFSEAIVTTYSLDLLSLLIVPLHFTELEYEGRHEGALPDPLSLLTALQDNSDRLSIYCQAGQISVPPHQQRLFGYLEPSVVEVAAPRQGGAFHPKVWVLRYTAGDEVHYRVGVFSRNLTADRSWDTALILEGDLEDRKRGFGESRPLSEFVAALPEMAIRSLNDKVLVRANRMSKELRKVLFDLPDGIEELAFWPMGHSKRSTRPIEFGGRRGLLVSPFLTDSVLSEFAKSVDDATLVSRQDALDAISPSTLVKFRSIKVMADAIAAELSAEESAPARQSLSGLHAKLYAFEDGWNVHYYTGSANATHAAMNLNVEFMVELVGKRKASGINTLLSPDDSRNAFGALLQEYLPPANGPIPESSEQELDRLLDREAARWATQLSGLEAQPAGEGRWALTVVAQPVASVAPEFDIQARCRPISLPEGGEVPLQLSTPDQAAVFGELSEGALTSFLVVRLTARSDNVIATKEFVLNLPLSGGPMDRRAAIVRAILKDRRAVLRFLAMLLGDIESALLGDLTGGVEDSGDGWRPGSASDAHVLFEPLLRALHREPERLDRVHRLVTELAGPDGADRLPEGWNEIWPPIWAERERLRG